MIKKYGEDVEIRFHYADWRGRLLVKALCDLFNDVANMQTKELGFDVSKLNAQGLTWMLHRLHIKIIRMPKQGEEVRIETWPSGIDRLFALRDFSVFKKDGKELVRASSGWMVIDVSRRRPMRLPTIVTEAMKDSSGTVPQISFDLNVKHMPADGYENVRKFVATYDDIDFNKHVTQAAYVRWLTNSLSYEFLRMHEMREIEVIYEHEIFPDSEVYSENYVEGREGQVTVYHRLRDVQRNRTYCQARSEWVKIEK